MTPRLIEGLGVLLEPEDARLLAVAARAVQTEHARAARAAGGSVPVGLEAVLRALTDVAGADPVPLGAVSCRSWVSGGGGVDADVVTVEQAAGIAGVKPRAVRKALEDGRLVGYQRAPGCAWAVDRHDLERWMPRRKRAS